MICQKGIGCTGCGATPDAARAKRKMERYTRASARARVTRNFVLATRPGCNYVASNSHLHGSLMGPPMGRFVFSAALLMFFLATPAIAQDAGVVIAIKDHQFVPSEVEIPAGQKVKLIVRNQDSTVSEFESVEFHREKVVQPGGEITVFVGPLDPGRYEFFDDFHPDTRGHLIVK
jgi:plastocyanin